ncbi:MAG TPA: hypothetical protein VFQ38_11685 [Longimicrobiales bacterium]|nr:hypothetical protein [Longimicrobiales bacterium]
MTRSRTLAVALLAAAAFGAPPAAAQGATPVGVFFHLADPRFRARFGAQAGDVELAIADTVAVQLARRIGFVRFVANTAADYRLVLTVDRRDRGSAGAFDERGIWARLESPEAGSAEIYWLVLRPADAATRPVGSAVNLRAEVAALLERADLGLLKEKLLRNVPISHGGLPWDRPVGWAIPLTHDDLCIQDLSVLRVVSTVKEGAMTLARSYDASVTGVFVVAPPVPAKAQQFLKRVFTEPVDESRRAEIGDAIRRGAVTVSAVYVLDYQPDPDCRPTPLPPQLPGPGGPGR